MDSREQNTNGFRSNLQMNQNITIPPRIESQNFIHDHTQELYSPQIPPNRNRQFQVGQNSENVRKSMITTHNSPAKFDFFQRNNNQKLNFETIPERLNPTNLSQPINQNKQNGRICHSMILQQSKNDNNFQNPNHIFNISSISNASSNNYTNDLESTFSSDIYNSYTELNSPSFSDQRDKQKKLEPVHINRKKEDVWKSMVHSYSPIKSENLPSKSQFLSYEDIKGGINTSNNYKNNNTETFRKEDNLYDIKRTSSENIKQPMSYNY